ncbi:hypothetical protein [Streptomyces sp. NPDC001568]|uniref:hypothetical protein n=1 Tax=Streptomyces sp. NPDC001568 TaxID=3364588 RepID=UPI003675F6BA
MTAFLEWTGDLPAAVSALQALGTVVRLWGHRRVGKAAASRAAVDAVADEQGENAIAAACGTETRVRIEVADQVRVRSVEVVAEGSVTVLVRVAGRAPGGRDPEGELGRW